VILPIFKPSSMHWHNLAGVHFAPGVHGSVHLVMAWVFVMTWSVLGMEGAACYIGECDNPSRDAKIAMSAEGLYGFFIFVLTAVSLLLVLGIAKNADPLTIFSDYITKIVGSSGSWVEWAIGLPLIFALLMSMLNAIMGCSRSLYQSSEDAILPRWFGRLNQHSVPAQAMAFTAVCSILVVLFGSPLRIYIFSNVGYLFAIALVFYGYFLHRHTKPDIERPVRLPHAMRWLALAAGVFLTVLWAYGGWNSPSVVIGTKSSSLFLLGLAVMAAYLPLHLWRRFTDRRLPPTVVDVTDTTVGGPGPVEPIAALADRVES
jgi:amino acid transporter